MPSHDIGSVCQAGVWLDCSSGGRRVLKLRLKCSSSASAQWGSALEVLGWDTCHTYERSVFLCVLRLQCACTQTVCFRALFFCACFACAVPIYTHGCLLLNAVFFCELEVFLPHSRFLCFCLWYTPSFANKYSNALRRDHSK